MIERIKSVGTSRQDYFREYQRKIREQRKAIGQCISCHNPATHGIFCVDHHKERQIIRKRFKKNTKEVVFEHYGNACACCGEDEQEFLTIDHIHNNGSKHRKENDTGKGFNLYRWLINNNYPSGFQLLCWNCNCAKQFNKGVCPHKTKRKTK